MGLLIAMAPHSTCWAQSDPAALKCAQRFVDKMASIKGYSLHLQKRETVEGKTVDEPIELWSEGQTIKYKFVADGSSGVKNNGMTLIYDGGDRLNIIWGKPTFLGALTNKAARALMGSSVPLVDERTLKGEIFTLNRAGYGHLATSLRYHLPALRSARSGGLTREGENGCDLKHTPTQLDYATVHLKPGDRIQDLEEKYGTFAYHIQQINADKFPNLEALFKHKDEVDIRVPLFFLPFELKVDEITGFVNRFIIYLEGHKIGDYTFTDVKSW